MMEGPKYYEVGKDDTYYVHFANKQALSIPEIKEIFSEWGNVHAVTKAGDEYGYRFVRYRQEDEVKRCVEGMRNHSTIRLLKPRPPTGQQKNGQKTKQVGGNINYSQENSSLKQPKNYDNDRAQNDDVRHGIDVSTVRGSPGMNVGRGGWVPNDGDATSSLDPSGDPLAQKTFPIGNTGEVLPASGRVEKKPPPSVVTSDPREDSANIPKLVSATFDDRDRSGGGVIFKDNLGKALQANNRIIVAEQVAVANVPTDYSESLVLHLLRKQQPICISPMKLAADTAIRYCVVSFMNVQQANAVVSEFYGRALDGHDLIVLRL